MRLQSDIQWCMKRIVGRMKILQVITRSELGGAQTVVAQLANKLSRDNDVILVAGEGDGKLWDIVNNDVQKCFCPHLRRKVSVIDDLLAIRELRKIYKQTRPDIIHLHSSKAGTLGRIVFPRKKIVYTVHGFDSIRLAFRKFLPIERLLQHFCSAVVGVSEYDSCNLRSEGIKNNVVTIYNGITKPDSMGLAPIEIMNTYRKIILSIARVSPPKRPDLFIKIARLLPEYGFIWVGNQEDMSGYDLPENCHFVGNRYNAGAYCSMADIFVLLSDYEGLPMTIIEAMSFGKPIISSNVGGVSEIVHDGENGYLLPNDASAFAEKIRFLIENNEVYASMSETSEKMFHERMNIEKMIGGYMKIYNSLL